MERPTNEDKANEVARNSIWREHVKKEDSLYRAPSPFRVDPKRIRPLPDKPIHSDPKMIHQMDLNNDGTITEEEKARYNAMWGALGSVDKNPTQKSTHAMTEAQIYGWMLERPQSRSMQRSASKWNRGKASCEIVSYADAYVTMAKCSPFAKAASNRS